MGNLTETLEMRRDRLQKWLVEHAPEVEVPLKLDTPEQAYWHLGYLIAVKDILRWLENND